MEALGGKTSSGTSAHVQADVAWLRAYGAAIERACKIESLTGKAKALRQIDLAFANNGRERARRAELYRSLGLDY